MIGVNYSTTESWVGYTLFLLKFVFGVAGFIKSTIALIKNGFRAEVGFVIAALSLVCGGVANLVGTSLKDYYTVELSSPIYNETEKIQIRESYNSTVLLWMVGCPLLLAIVSTIATVYSRSAGAIILTTIGWILTLTGIFFAGRELGWWA
jgi:hypothetical protein